MSGTAFEDILDDTQTPLTKEQLELLKLKNQVQKQKNKVEALKGNVKKGGPSNLSRIFDVLSRGSYAGSEATLRLTKGQGPSGFASGLWAGLSGKKKTSYSDVLKEAGVKNKFALTAGGLAGDILLDPTTYIGVGVEKAAGKLSLEAAGATALKAASKSNEIKEVGLKALAEAGKEGSIAKKAKAITTAAKDNYILESVAKAKDKAAEEGGKVFLKVAGKQVPLGYIGEKAYKGPAKVGQIIGKTSGGQTLRQAFHTAAAFPGQTLMLKRMFESQGVAEAENVIKELRHGNPETGWSGFNALNKEEKRHIAHAIEGEFDLTGEVSAKSGLPLEDYRQKAVAVFKDFNAVEGLPVDNEADLLLHHYRQGGKKIEEFRKSGKPLTLKNAKEFGLDPVEEIDDILALRVGKHHQTVARKQFAQAVTDEYGVKLSKHEAKLLGWEAPEHEFVKKGVYFPSDIAKTLGTIHKLHTDDDVANAFLKHFDRVQGAWKFMATASNPGHHIRNLAGDIFLNWEDGVTNPARYMQAVRTLKPELRKSLKVRVGSKVLDGEEIYREFIQSGAKSGFFRTEFGAAGHTPGKVIEHIRNFSESREDFGRMAHFIDALKKEGKNVKDYESLREASIKATQRVRKYNLDYGDLTEFERKYMKRVIPFYTWTRKNIPLQIETLALKPGRMAQIPKGQKAIERLLGTNEDDPSIGEVIPKWIREMSTIRLLGEGHGRNAIYWGPPTPLQDLSIFEGGLKTREGREEFLGNLLSKLSPTLRIPIEQATGEQIFSGAPVKGDLQYSAEQIPMARVISQLAQGKGGRTVKLPGTNIGLPIKLVNYLLGSGLYEVTPQSQKGELRRQQDPLQAEIKRLKEKRKKELLND